MNGLAPAVFKEIDSDPDKALEPDHEPEAVHDVAFAVDQVNVTVDPIYTWVSETDRVIVALGTEGSEEPPPPPPPPQLDMARSKIIKTENLGYIALIF